jgi:hypothetical protein
MPGKELAETRRYEVGDFPPGTRMLIADRRDLDAMLARGEIRAVGKFQQLSGGATGLPAVYVSRRAKPFHERHRVALVVTGALVTLAAGIAAIILTVGLGWFIGGVVLMAFTIATLVRYSQGGGRHRVSVTTTTTTNVRVR